MIKLASETRVKALVVAGLLASATACSFFVDQTGEISGSNAAGGSAGTAGTGGTGGDGGTGGETCEQRLPPCELYASTTGLDTSSGSAGEPFLTVQKLVDSLGSQSGKYVGCLHEGTYLESVVISNAGDAEPRRDIVIKSVPGERRATLIGRLNIEDTAHFVTIAYLNLDGAETDDWHASPHVHGNHSTWLYNDITNSTGSCFYIGGGEKPNGTTLRYNRIHDCGRRVDEIEGDSDPGSGNSNASQGIEFGHSLNAVVEYNLIYSNTGRGILFLPDADFTQIRYNIVDRNGRGIQFSAASPGENALGHDSTDNEISHNVFSFSRVGYNIEGWYAGGPTTAPAGSENEVSGGCSYGRIIGGTIQSGHGLPPKDDAEKSPTWWAGFDVRPSVLAADPEYVQPAPDVGATVTVPDYHLNGECLTDLGVDVAAEVERCWDEPLPE